MEIISLYFLLKIGIPLFMIGLAVLLILWVIIINIFKQKFYKNCKECVNYKFYDTFSAGNNCKYKCSITNRIDIIDYNTTFVPIKKCKSYKEE